jgi:NMD protein affecting ribosome stability and mRNA decay
MKQERGQWRPLQREQLLQEVVHDSYKERRKLREPTRCPKCAAVYRSGRWSWRSASGPAHEILCPACRRLRDRFPAGYVRMTGAFLREHREEILHLAHHCARQEGAEHPLERIMAIEEMRGGIVLTTTSIHLARRIAEALHRAYKGELRYHYNRAENLLRASWRRSE